MAAGDPTFGGRHESLKERHRNRKTETGRDLQQEDARGHTEILNTHAHKAKKKNTGRQRQREERECVSKVLPCSLHYST